jgi:hypothetical protein
MVFFEHKEENTFLREECLRLFTSSECIKRILVGRCKMANKLQMVKFIDKMRFNILSKGKGYKWKDIIKKLN